MAEVLVSTEDLVVVGGPSQISISLDVGATGDPGSMIYYGSGNPNSSSTVLGFTPKLLDMYINLDPTDDQYQYLYQYQSVFGVDEWVPLFRMFSNIYRKNTTAASTIFVDGSADIYVPVADIVPADMVSQSSPADFNVQHSILGDYPIMSSMAIAASYSTIDLEKFLKLTIHASESVDGSTLQAVEGERVIHLLITMV